MPMVSATGDESTGADATGEPQPAKVGTCRSSACDSSPMRRVARRSGIRVCAIRIRCPAQSARALTRLTDAVLESIVVITLQAHRLAGEVGPHRSDGDHRPRPTTGHRRRPVASEHEDRVDRDPPVRAVAHITWRRGRATPRWLRRRGTRRTTRDRRCPAPGWSASSSVPGAPAVAAARAHVAEPRLRLGTSPPVSQRRAAEAGGVDRSGGSDIVQRPGRAGDARLRPRSGAGAAAAPVDLGRRPRRRLRPGASSGRIDVQSSAALRRRTLERQRPRPGLAGGPVSRSGRSVATYAGGRPDRRVLASPRCASRRWNVTQSAPGSTASRRS